MAERPVLFEGRNLALAALNVALFGLGALLWFGPGATELEREREEIEILTRRNEEWAERAASMPPIDPTQLERWTADFQHLAEHGFDHGNDTVLLGGLANWLKSPGVSQLDITPVAARGDEEAEEQIVVQNIEGTERRVLRQVPMRARFQADYRAFSQLMARLSDTHSPVEVQRLEASRQFPNIKVDLQLALWTHAEAPQ